MMLGYLGAGLVGFSIFLAIIWFMAGDPSPRPEVGTRGLKRRQALEQGGLFASSEPLIRFLAAKLQGLEFLEDMRKGAEKRILHAGDWLGLTGDEFLAMSLLSGGGTLGAAYLFAILSPGITPIFLVLLGCLGFVMPNMQVSSVAETRFKQVNRGLPFAIDLASLSMGAGLDFPGALRQVAEKSPDKTDALYEEIMRVLNELDLGRTRRQALEGFMERAPTESVKDFCSSVIQSEEKGNPLAEVLNIQATMLRMRRSVAAEEGAAKAGLMLMGPLMMIFGCIILLLMGPFAVTMATGGGF